MFETVLTPVGDVYPFLRTAVAGKTDDIYQRRLIVLLLYHALIDALGCWRMLVDRPDRHTHRDP